ncbi:MAG: hypothetical protein ACK44N_09690 [Bacteroidota bacterium]|jgi:hypothetical protein
MKTVTTFFFIILAANLMAQGPLKKKKSNTNKTSVNKSTIIVNELATPNDSIKIVNGRNVYIDKNGVQSLKVVN